MLNYVTNLNSYLNGYWSVMEVQIVPASCYQNESGLSSHRVSIDHARAYVGDAPCLA